MNNQINQRINILFHELYPLLSLQKDRHLLLSLEWLLSVSSFCQLHIEMISKDNIFFQKNNAKNGEKVNEI
jgi:hypothetical protein